MNSTTIRPFRWAIAFTMLAASVPCVPCLAEEPRGEKSVTIRCAVIGGMMDTDFWPTVSARFEKRSGHKVEVVAAGPKHGIAEAFRNGQADLITMHASDKIINLVADGYGVDPQPWARNDLLLVGPKSDPARVRGEKDVVAALAKILKAKSKVLVHASLGVQDVLSDVLAAGELELDPERTISLPGDKHRQMLKRASAEEAYTLVGRIPFLNAKIPSGDMVIMVQGDPKLRRPYLVVTAKPSASGDARNAAARELARFLREPETQRFIAEFGKGKYDDQPLFFPVVVEPAQVPAKAK
jgi:tungstate transport system substrate-binding protein